MQTRIITLNILKVTKWSARILIAMFQALEGLYNFTIIEAFVKEFVFLVSLIVPSVFVMFM
jgi:hypothetical protein